MLNAALPFSYHTILFHGFAALVVPSCPESPARTLRCEMFVLGRVGTSLKQSRFAGSLPCVETFELPTVPFAGDKHGIKMIRNSAS